MNTKNSITWVTAEYFVDVDLPILPYLSHYYDITWLIIISKRSKIDYTKIINEKCQNTSIKYKFIYLRNRAGSPKIITDYYKLIKVIKNVGSKLIYYDFGGIPYYFTLFYPFISKKKSIIALHNVTTPNQASNQKISAIYNYFVRHAYKNFQVFSQSQLHILEALHPNKNILYAPLALKDFGEPQTLPNKDITFLFFGFIRGYKRVDVLIDAAQMAYENTHIKFKVCIAGQCDNWNEYEKRIKYPDLFDLQIRNIPNEEVADLFGKAHYFVMPYQDIAQSGAMTVGLRYNLPIIASELPAFKEFMIDKETGFFIEPANKKDLSKIMIYILSNHSSIYNRLRERQKEYINQTLSIENITNKYVKYLDSILNI